jgi:hypothetical protein
MSQTLSNLYVEKISSEHPLAVWMLNEEAFFVSSITESNKDLSDSGEWLFTNATPAVESPTPVGSPVYDIETPTPYRIVGDVPGGPTMTIEAESVFTKIPADFDLGLKSLSLGFHLYVDTQYATSITYGFTYYDTVLLTDVDVFTTEVLAGTDNGLWKFFGGTFDIPVSNATGITFIIRINVTTGGSAGDYDFLVMGLSIGQNSENFQKISTGSIPVAISADISLPNTLKVVSAIPYGPTSQDAYYLADSNKLFAKNFGVPLTYGSSNSTKIYPNPVDDVYQPSLIFPGYGFLNNKGKYNQYTAELWMSINTDAADPRRIFGPIASTDGLYIEGGIITLVVGGQYGSHYVGNWLRPMLIHIKYLKDTAILYLNGEQVVSIEFDESLLVLPDEFDEFGKSQDWLGVYAYEDTHPITLDSFAIYSYPVPVDVAKRRWVWGQGVVAPEGTNSSINAVTAFNDYSFADYSVNYNYPDFANWKQGFASNLDTSSSFLKLPAYTLPEFVISESTQEQLLLDLQTAETAADPKYYSFRPDISWADRQCYMLFKEFSVLSEPVKNLYGVFETDGSASGELLFYITKKNSNDVFMIELTGDSLNYVFDIQGTSYTFSVETITLDEPFVAGINIANVSGLPIDGLATFFSNQSELSLYVGGWNGPYTFTGKTYKIGFDGEYNSRHIVDYFNTDGVFDPTDATALLAHTANYTLVPLEKYGIFFMDIAVAAYWEDYMPLSYFAKYVEDYDGNRFYDLDSIQINLDFPEPTEVAAAESTSSWTYGDLEIAYSDPVQLIYQDIQNTLYTTWENYEDMEQASIKYYYYTTGPSAMRSYVSFQYLVDGANINLMDYLNKATPRVRGVADPAGITGDWEDTAYEVVNGTIIYPPLLDKNDKSVDFNDLAVVYHLDFKSEGILHNPISLRELQLASEVLERKKFTTIGTKFGVPVYPYSKLGLYYNLKAKNPIGVYKGSTPHLYLDRHSGFRIRGEFSPILDRGISVPINTQKASNMQVGSMQVWLRFSDTAFPTEETPIFYIVHKNDTYTFYLKNDTYLERGYIVGRDSAGNILTDVNYTLNGASVNKPFIVNEEWVVLGVGFTNLLDFASFSGRLNLGGPLTYNNISYYLATNLTQEQRVQNRTWGEISADPGDWSTWEPETWSFVDILGITTFYDINPSEIYSKYVGTDRIIIDDNIGGILVDPEKLRVYGDVNWLTKTVLPV